MSLSLVPALLAAGLMVVVGVGAALKPTSLETVHVVATSALGRSEIRSVFGGMFVALGLACILLREPVVFAVVGAAWLADVAVRVVSALADPMPRAQALAVLGTGLAMGLALLSGYWLA